MARKRKRSGASKRVGEKISYLRHEGVSQKQAVGEAMGMERSGRLGRHGVYHRKHKRSRGRG